MTPYAKRLSCTLQLIVYALLPKREGGEEAPWKGEVRSCGPREIRGGVERFLDGKGELRLFFPVCLALAAPMVLFRLKREGFSGCRVQVSEKGLYVRGRR